MIASLFRRSSGAPSSAVAIGTATMFALYAAVLSFAVDRPRSLGKPSAPVGAGWILRGAVGPAPEPGDPARSPDPPAHHA